ncbi:solute carrier family 35 member E1 homolog [Saccostrea echinata]|uniref:solute carrier family 35 member E1 homolog n=1 Tax=Saccostrea echinata TaxID=191078 RepID=UPI002A7FED81|nr:solute carrier family 35 member E1 homolog [Saccostrea echinata]
MEEHNYVETLKFIMVCLMWYICSAGGNIIGKLVLNEFPYPVTVTMTQLISISVYMEPIFWFLQTPNTGNIPRSYYYKLILPLAFGKFFSSVSSHISIWKSSVSYAHTVKATLPLFTVVLSRVLLGETQTLPVYLSIVPIIVGVIVATLTEVSFEALALLSALVATLGFSLQSIFSKKCLKDTGINHLRLLVLLSRIATIFFLPFWLLFDCRNIANSDVFENTDVTKSLLLLILDGLFYMLHNVFAFTVIAMVAPLSYSVANAMKRVVIISASLFLLRNPVTTANVVGMLVACFGVLCYNKAKFDQNMARRRAETLPLVHSETNLQAHLNPKGLPHSKTEVNLLNRNGMIHPEDHILLQNNVSVDHVTLFPPSNPWPVNQTHSRHTPSEQSQLVSRGSHRIFEI